MYNDENKIEKIIKINDDFMIVTDEMGSVDFY